MEANDPRESSKGIPVSDVRPSSSQFNPLVEDDDLDVRTLKKQLKGDPPELTSWYLSPSHYQSCIPSEYSTLKRNTPFSAPTVKAEKSIHRGELEELRATRVEELSINTLLKPWRTEMIQRMHFNAAYNSPFLSDLARLKMEKLKLEEAYLLKKKCESELERTRGPRPKWYELKSKEFHREANRNNFMLSNQRNWDDIFDYRDSLDQSISRWSNFHL